MGYEAPGAEYITDTAAHTGRFSEIYALEDAVIATLVAQDWTGNATTSVPLKAGDEIKGVFTSVTLASGKVVAYRI